MALCLARAGCEVEILERAPQLREVGAGLQLSPNALRVLDGLGLLDRLNRSAVSARSVTLRSGRSGRVLATVPVLSDDGTPYLSILRSDLQTALLEAVEAEPRIRLVLDQTLVSLSATAPYAIDLVTADSAGARTTRAARPLVIAADGFRSAVSEALGLSAPRSTGLTAYRMMLAAPSPTGRIEAWLGPRRHAVAYPVSGGAATNLVAIGPAISPEATSSPIDKSWLLGGFSAWDASLLDLFERAGTVTAWPLFETSRMDEALPEGVLLIGDAAHAMLPFAAQGAAMAIEDAAVLAHVLETSPSSAEALARFALERKPRLERVRKRVAFHRFVYHLPAPFAWGRNLVLAQRPERALRRDLAWLYDWTPPAH